MRYFVRRISYSLFLLFGVSLLTFVLVDLAPGEFVDVMRLNPQVSAATIAGLRAQQGLDQPLPVRYFRWVESAVQGNWGFSFAYNSPAAPIVWVRARNTLLLTGTATVLAWLVAIPFGIWAAAQPGKIADAVVKTSIATLLAIPEIILALLLLLIAVRTRVLPVGGMVSLDFAEADFWSKCKNIATHLFVPSLCLAAGLLPLLLSHVRAAMAETLQSPFITAARASGIPRFRLLYRHALPVAANPLISLFGFSVGILVSSSVLVEGIFSWPGLGQLMIEAILQRDFYLVVDSAMIATVFLVFGNLLADTLLYAVDPRIRAE